MVILTTISHQNKGLENYPTDVQPFWKFFVDVSFGVPGMDLFGGKKSCLPKLLKTIGGDE